MFLHLMLLIKDMVMETKTKKKGIIFTNSQAVIDDLARIKAYDASLGITEEDKKNMTFTEYLRTKKERGGKLSKLGEWLLANEDTGLYIRESDMKYVLR